jgi:RNA polymerase sigma-70 factor (ECF subfamily)
MKRQRIQQGTFATTQWHVVRQATEGPDRRRVEALNDICARYVPAMVEYIKRQFHVTEDVAEDMVQQFVTDRVLSKDILSQAVQTKGRFRTFLMTSIRHFVCDQIRRESSMKRCPPNGFVPLEDMQTETTAALEQEEQRVFDQGFVRQIIGEAIHRTHELCVKRNQTDIWEILHERVLAPHIEEVQPESYDILVQELGLRNRAEAQNKLATGKRIFQRCYQQVIEEFTESAQEFEEEWHYLSRFFAPTRQETPSKNV